MSLVIPAFNEEKVILRKLKSISEINYPREKIEIIIVDDGSTGNTKEVAKNFIASNARALARPPDDLGLACKFEADN